MTSIETLCDWPDATTAYHVGKVGSCNESKRDKPYMYPFAHSPVFFRPKKTERFWRRHAVRGCNESERNISYVHVTRCHCGYAPIVAGFMFALLNCGTALPNRCCDVRSRADMFELVSRYHKIKIHLKIRDYVNICFNIFSIFCRCPSL